MHKWAPDAFPASVVDRGGHLSHTSRPVKAGSLELKYPGWQTQSPSIVDPVFLCVELCGGHAKQPLAPKTAL